MSDLTLASRRLRAEADLLLYQYGLMPILEEYGKPYPTGSYVLDLMTWRDLDLYLAVDEFDRGAFFALGHAISAALRPYKMSFRDELEGKTPGLPAGWYWGSYSKLIPGTDWKVDLWMLKVDQVDVLIAQVGEIAGQLVPDTREAILAIKAEVCTSPMYRREVHATDIYEAVISGGVSTAGEFWSWMSAHGTGRETG